METGGEKIDMHHVKQVENLITNGVTRPLRCILDNGVRAVVKVFNNEQGNLTLVNEYICYKLAKVLGIPMPLSGVCLCDDETIDIDHELSVKNKGYGFFSTYIEKNTILKPGIMRHVLNIDIFYKVAIFDHLIYNKDRNIANLLVEYSKNGIKITVIDHTHVFKNETIWDARCFEIGMEEQDYLDEEIMRSNDDMYRMFTQTITVKHDKLVETVKEVQRLLMDDIISGIVMSVPGEWNVSERDLLALKDYLIYRKGHLREMCDVIYRYIQNS